jgi:hypothetical protein
LVDASCLPVYAPWKIFNPHSTTTMADISVAAVNTLSKEATLILLSASSPIRGLVDSLIPPQPRGHNSLKTARGCVLRATYHRNFMRGRSGGEEQRTASELMLAVR